MVTDDNEAAEGAAAGAQIEAAVADVDAAADTAAADTATAEEEDEMDEEERAYEEKRRIRREKDRERREKSGKISKRITEADYSATRAQLAAIEDYVNRGDPDEVARERTVTLAPDQPKASSTATDGRQNTKYYDNGGGLSGNGDGDGNNNGGGGDDGDKHGGGGDKNGGGSGGGGGGGVGDAGCEVAHLSTKYPGKAAVDRRVKVFWPEEGAFFNGIVAAFNPETGKHTVRYDDGDVEEVALGSEKMEWLEPGGDTLGVRASVSVAANGDISDPTKPPGWWPVVGHWPVVDGEERRRKVMGTEVKEQETYGVDYVTARDVIACFKKVLPEYGEDDLWLGWCELTHRLTHELERREVSNS